jgi:hypothetical protein
MTPGTIGLNEAEPAKPMRIIKASNSLRELLDLLTERGLGYAETLCGAPEIQLLGGGDKIAEVAKLHPSSCGNPNSSSIWCSESNSRCEITTTVIPPTGQTAQAVPCNRKIFSLRRAT